MLKTSKATQPKSITTSRTKVKVITTSSTRKSRSETTSITNKKLFKLSTITPFTSLRTPTSSSTSSSTSLSPTTTSSSSFSPTTTSPPTTTSKSLLYPTLSLPRSSLPTSTSSSSLSSLSSLPFTTIFNSQSQQQPQQESQLQSFIITPHLHQQFNDPFCSLARSFQRKINTPFHLLTKSFQHKLLSQSNVFHSTKVQFKDESKPDYFEPLSIFDELGSLTPDVITFKYLNSNEFKAAMEEFELEARNNPIEALLTFTGAVAEHYPSKPLEFVTKFIRVNRTIFKRLFQHQIIKSIPSLKGDTTEQDEIDAKQAEIDEIVQIIFEWYHNIPKLISQLRGKGHSDENIGTLLSDLYPKHFHKEINTLSQDINEPSVFIKQQESSDKCEYVDDVAAFVDIDGQSVPFYIQKVGGPFINNFRSFIHTLRHYEPILAAIESSCHSFIKVFEHDDIQKKIIAKHTDDWHSNPIHIHKIHQLLGQLATPQFHPLPTSVILTARSSGEEIFSDNAGQEIISDTGTQATTTSQAKVNKHRKLFEQTKKAVSIINTKIRKTVKEIIDFKSSIFPSCESIILPINNKHLALSYQQVSLMMAVRCLQKHKFGKKTSPTEEQIFQFVTGLTLNEYMKENENKSALSLLFFGSKGIGKSLVLLLLYFIAIFNVDFKDEKDVQCRTKVDILTCNRSFQIGNTTEPSPESFQIEIHKDDNGKILRGFVRQKVVENFTHITKFTSHFYDEPDSLGSRVQTNHNTTTAIEQTNQTPRVLNSHSMIRNGIEVRVLSTQDSNLRPLSPTHDLRPVQRHNPQSRYDHNPNPHQNYIDLPPDLLSQLPPPVPCPISNPIYLCSGPSPIQTALSFTKSSLYQQYLQSSSLPKDSTTSTQILQDIQSISFNDFLILDLYNEWDNGKSLRTSPSKPLPIPTHHDKLTPRPLIPGTTSQISDLPSKRFQAFCYPNYISDLYNPVDITPKNRCQSQQQASEVQTNNGEQIDEKKEEKEKEELQTNNIITKLLQQLYPKNDTNQRLQQLLYELRLLPYVSPSMRSANILFSQFINMSPRPALTRYDLFNRFFPHSFQHIFSSYQQHQIKPPTTFHALTQYSQLPYFLRDDDFISFFPLTSSQDSILLNMNRFQAQIDTTWKSFTNTTRGHFVSGQIETLYTKIYAPNCKYHFYIDTTLYPDLSKERNTPSNKSNKRNTPSNKSNKRNTPSNKPIKTKVKDVKDVVLVESLDFPNDPKYYQLFEQPTTHSPASLSPIILPSHPTSTTQYVHINQSLLKAIQYVYNAYKYNNSPITTWIGSGGASGYPVFDSALVYLHQDSTQKAIKIGVHPVQITAGKYSTTPKESPSYHNSLWDLYCQISAFEKEHPGATVEFKDWSFLSKGNVIYDPKCDFFTAKQITSLRKRSLEPDDVEKKLQERFPFWKVQPVLYIIEDLTYSAMYNVHQNKLPLH